MGDFLGGGTSSKSSSTNTRASTSTTSSPYAQPLGDLGKLLTAIGSPLASLSGSQYLEALRTGGVNSFLPFITRALDAVRSSGSQGVEQLRQQLARSGLGRTGYAQSALAEAKQSAAENVAMTPEQTLWSWLTGAGSFGKDLLSGAGAALTSAGGLSRTTSETSTGTSTGTTETTKTPGLLDFFKLGIDLGGGFSGGGP